MRALLLLFISFGSFAQGLKQYPTDTITDWPKGYYELNDTVKSEFVRITDIVISGNTKTRKQIILREIEILIGETYQRSELEKTLKRNENNIFNTRLFVTSEVRLIDVAPGFAYVLVMVTERWYVFPAPIFKLADRNFNDWWVNQNADPNRVEYGIRFIQENIRGMNERLKVSAQAGFTRQLEISYLFPYLTSKQRLGMNFGFNYSENVAMAFQSVDNKLQFYRDEDRNIVRNTTRGFLTFNYREAIYNTHTFNLEYLNNWIADTIAVLNPDYFLDGHTRQQFMRIRYEFKRDLRDVRAYPLRGFQLQMIFRNAGLGLWKDINKTELVVNYDKFFDLKNNFFLSSSVRTMYSSPRRLPYNEFKGLGYEQNYLRGYELYVMEGQGYAMNKLDFKYRLLDGRVNLGRLMPLKQFRTVPYSLLVKTYLDHGIVHMNIPYAFNDRLLNTYLVGYGVGIDYVTFYDSVVRMEFSRNVQGENGFFLHFKAAF